jgi:hypothetical protein
MAANWRNLDAPNLRCIPLMCGRFLPFPLHCGIASQREVAGSSPAVPIRNPWKAGFSARREPTRVTSLVAPSTRIRGRAGLAHRQRSRRPRSGMRRRQPRPGAPASLLRSGCIQHGRTARAQDPYDAAGVNRKSALAYDACLRTCSCSSSSPRRRRTASADWSRRSRHSQSAHSGVDAVPYRSANGRLLGSRGFGDAGSAHT